MHKVFKKEQVLTIPNLLSLIRLALIPVIVWLYCHVQKYYAAIAVIILSGVTDIADGIIARKFNMVSDFGKILDPIADKMTQVTLITCLTFKYEWMWVLVVLFVVKELLMGSLGYLSIKSTDTVNSAKWHGKMNTVVLYTVMVVLIMFPEIPDIAANIMIGVCSITMCFSLVLYSKYYIGLIRNSADKSNNNHSPI